jgi:DNA-binding MarR family transcriptional regulator
MKQKKERPLEKHVGYWIRFVSNHVSHAFGQRLAEYGVTVAEWVVLSELLRMGETAPSGLAEALGMTRGAISKLAERLVGKRFVKRTTESGDRRFQKLALTVAGRELVPKLVRAADANDEAFFGHLPKRDRQYLVALCRGIAEESGLKGVAVD